MRKTLFKKIQFIERLSIKQLTLLGFTLVALPLVLALMYSAKQVNQLSTQGSAAIFNVAELVNINRELSDTVKKMQRYASQYIVLQDKELVESYLIQEQQALTFLSQLLASFGAGLADSNAANSFDISREGDKQLIFFISSFKQAVTEIHQQFFYEKAAINVLTKALTEEKPTLENIQESFNILKNIQDKINLRSNALINAQATDIKNTAEHVSNNILKSLIIIPITLFIASIFIVLITKPLRHLTTKIQRLEQGDFQHKISVTGSIEVREIAEALDVMRTRLHALELQKSSFIRHISHELKTPLAAIREGTELLYDNSVGALNDEQQEVCHIIRSSVSKLQQLIEDLLDFNIVLDSTSLQDSEKLSLAELVHQTINHHQLDIKRKNITVEHFFADIILYSNAKQLSVILDNLLSNAIKYSPQNGIVTIEATVQKQQLQLSICDQGVGIKSDQQAKIFDAFYQGVAPTDTTIKGSGLGLTIVKELLMRLNGSIEVCSPVENGSTRERGTLIKISLSRASLVSAMESLHEK